MPLFRYEVADPNGKIMLGAMDAGSEAEVRQALVEKGYRVNLVVPAMSVGSSAAASIPRASIKARVTQPTSPPPREMAVFFRQLASLLTAGVNVHQALVQIGDQTPLVGMRSICRRMAVRIQAGDKLSECMKEYPRAFPAHIVGVIAAGELGGFLPVVVGDVALDYEIAQHASGRWLGWVNRLLWVNAIGSLLIAPLLPILFSPGTTDLQTGIIRYLRFTTLYLALPILFLLIINYALRAILRRPEMRVFAHRVVLCIPSLAYASKMRSLASFTRVQWRLQQAGILPIQAWSAASQAAENSVISARLGEQSEAIRRGRRFSEAVGATGLFNEEDQRILAAAEAAGQIAGVLERVAAYYEDAARSAVARSRWFFFHIALTVNMIVLGVVIYCVEVRTILNVMDWVDWFFQQ